MTFDRLSKDIEQNLEFLAEAKKKKRLEEMLVGAEPPIIAASPKRKTSRVPFDVFVEVFVNQKKAVDVLSKRDPHIGMSLQIVQASH